MNALPDPDEWLSRLLLPPPSQDPSESVKLLKLALQETAFVLDGAVVAVEEKKMVGCDDLVDEGRRASGAAERLRTKAWGSYEEQLGALARCVVRCAKKAAACRFKTETFIEIEAETERKIQLADEFKRAKLTAKRTSEFISSERNELDEGETNNALDTPLKHSPARADIEIARAIVAGMKPPHEHEFNKAQSRTERFLNTIKNNVPLIGNELGSGYSRMSRRAVRRYQL